MPVLPVVPLVLFSSLSPATLALLVLISVVGGIGITAVGPGGVLVTIALFAMTDLSPAEVAGTAIATHIGTGVAGSLVYRRSGQLQDARTRRLALVLSVTGLIGTPAGVWINAHVSSRQFGIMLAIFVTIIGLSIVVRERRSTASFGDDEAGPDNVATQAAVGGAVAVASGMFGIGGPMISVPIMIVVGYPILAALAAAQVQSIVIAGTGTLSYLGQGAISWPLVIVTGAPQLIGVWLGWRIAHSVPARPLKYLLATILIVLGPVLLLKA